MRDEQGENWLAAPDWPCCDQREEHEVQRKGSEPMHLRRRPSPRDAEPPELPSTRLRLQQVLGLPRDRVQVDRPESLVQERELEAPMLPHAPTN